MVQGAYGGGQSKEKEKKVHPGPSVCWEDRLLEIYTPAADFFQGRRQAESGALSNIKNIYLHFICL
jgi:hypothetical protein